MENDPEFDFVTIRETQLNAEEEAIVHSREKLAGTLWNCFLLGALSFISLCGLIQQVHPTFLDTVRENKIINEIWFELHWGVWITLLTIFILLFIVIKNSTISKIRDKNK